MHPSVSPEEVFASLRIHLPSLPSTCRHDDSGVGSLYARKQPAATDPDVHFCTGSMKSGVHRSAERIERSWYFGKLSGKHKGIFLEPVRTQDASCSYTRNAIGIHDRCSCLIYMLHPEIFLLVGNCHERCILSSRLYFLFVVVPLLHHYINSEILGPRLMVYLPEI